MIKEDDIQTLMDFGLSYVQSLTYLTLVKLKKSDAKTIARVSTVARQDIYRIMPTLQKLGLVEKIIGSPTMYIATPIQNAVSILVDYKKREYTSLLKRSGSLVESLSSMEEKVSPSEEDTQFVITSELSLLLRLHEKMTKQCQNTLDILVPLRGVPSKVGDEWNFLRGMLKQRQIETRLITHRPESQDSAFVFWEPLLDEPFFHARYYDGPIHFGMHIFDRQQLTLSVRGHELLPSLWSNSPNMIFLATTYYDKLWNSKKTSP
ncbi:MAG: hypothetical protein NWE92_08650 [Candidatus Bathyarchaeota archaeon]|nr:hypothetical protein [Candidatus Bathyarchaeota archaeon]